MHLLVLAFFFFFQAEDGIRDDLVTGVQTCALPIWPRFQADADFNQKIVTGLRRREPSIDFLSARDGEVVGLPDAEVLRIASEAARSEERRVGKECRSRWSPYH